MRKWKILTSSLLVMSWTQLISLVSCNEQTKYYSVSVSHDDGVELTTETKIFGEDITIKCTFTNPSLCVDQGDGKTTVKADGIDVDWSVVGNDTIVIPHNESWTTTTKIEVDIKSTTQTYNVEVQKDVHISGYEISKTFFNDIVITCSFNSAYVLNENSISVKVGVEQKDYQYWEIDGTGKQLTITKDDSWSSQIPIKINLVSDEIDQVLIENLETQYIGTVGVESSSSAPITIVAHAQSSDIKYDVTSGASVSVEGQQDNIYYNDKTHKICWKDNLNKDEYNITITASYLGVVSEIYSSKLDIQPRNPFLGVSDIPEKFVIYFGTESGKTTTKVNYYAPDIAEPQNISKENDLTIKFSGEHLKDVYGRWEPDPESVVPQIIIDYGISLIPSGSPFGWDPGTLVINFKYVTGSTTLTLTTKVYCVPAIPAL